VAGPAFPSSADHFPPFRGSLEGQGVAARADVALLASGSAKEAVALARTIQHPWYRCQAITSVVEKNRSFHGAVALLNEALDAAYSQDEPNRVASVSFWPLVLLAKLDPLNAAVHTSRLLGIIANEHHGLRRLDGLCAILNAVAPVPELREQVLPPLLETAKISSGWRTERLMNGAIQVLATYDRAAAISMPRLRPISRFTKESRALLTSSSGPEASQTDQ
jgi:hypothetical protein